MPRAKSAEGHGIDAMTSSGMRRNADMVSGVTPRPESPSSRIVVQSHAKR